MSRGDTGQKGPSMSESRPRVLVVDDESAQMRALCHTLPNHGYDTIGFSDGETALAELRRTKCELLLADLMMPGMNGIRLLQNAREIDPDLVGIIMTGAGTIATAVEAMQAGALDYILKPFNLSVIVPVLERALTVRRLRLENAELGRRVRERTIELEAANKELEAFSYSVAHDLRGPLTVIIGDIDLLIEDYGAQLPVKGREILNSVMVAGEHMERLTAGLLRLSQLSRQPLTKCVIDMASLVREVLGELTRVHAGRSIAFHVGNLPNAVGDEALLKQVVTNLLANAFKFTRTRDDPRIELSARRATGENIYAVRDNGAGFDMQTADKLFAAFQRFHSAEQYEGTGIGLSIAARVIQRHGGRIWADAEVDKGATFYFSLPD